MTRLSPCSLKFDLVAGLEELVDDWLVLGDFELLPFGVGLLGVFLLGAAAFPGRVVSVDGSVIRMRRDY